MAITPKLILSAVAGGLCVIALLPAAANWPCVAVAGLLLAIANFVP